MPPSSLAASLLLVSALLAPGGDMTTEPEAGRRIVTRPRRCWMPQQELSCWWSAAAGLVVSPRRCSGRSASIVCAMPPARSWWSVARCLAQPDPEPGRHRANHLSSSLTAFHDDKAASLISHGSVTPWAMGEECSAIPLSGYMPARRMGCQRTTAPSTPAITPGWASAAALASIVATIAAIGGAAFAAGT
jgi:hypothetical protein